MWLKILLDELYMGIKGSALLCENKSCIALTNSPVQHQRTKNIDIHMHFTREKVLNGDIDLNFCSTEDRDADIFTNPLCATKFCEFHVMLGILEFGSNDHVGDLDLYL